VISGYLITQIIQKDIERGKFSFLSFYDRRIRRILPALVAMAVATTSVALLFFPPGDLLTYGQSLLATTGFASNFSLRSSTSTTVILEVLRLAAIAAHVDFVAGGTVLPLLPDSLAAAEQADPAIQAATLLSASLSRLRSVYGERSTNL